MVITMKVCSKCLHEKPADAEHFRLNARSHDGLDSYCRECGRAISREHYRENKARYRANERKYLEQRPELRTERNAQRRERWKQKHLADYLLGVKQIRLRRWWRAYIAERSLPELRALLRQVLALPRQTEMSLFVVDYLRETLHARSGHPRKQAADIRRGFCLLPGWRWCKYCRRIVATRDYHGSTGKCVACSPRARGAGRDRQKTWQHDYYQLVVKAKRKQAEGNDEY